MIDTQSINDLIEQQITKVVEQQVQARLDDLEWISRLEEKIIQYTQDRIVSRFANISTVPDLIETVKTSVGTLFENGQIPGLDTYIDKTSITATIDNGIQNLVDGAISNLVVDTAWITKIEQQVNLAMTNRLSRKLSEIDLNSLVAGHIDNSIDRWQEKFKKNFQTAGITDSSTSCQLTVIDGAVVVESELVANSLHIETDSLVKGTLTTNNLIVKGIINTDNASWNELSDHIGKQTLQKLTDEWKQELVDQVVTTAKTTGIEFDSVLINGLPIVSNDSLNPSIKESKLETLGQLRELSVQGTTKLNNTVHVHRGRVGINTDTPEMAFSVWDEEVSILAGKLSKQQGFIGTARLQNLAIGVNRIPQIEIDVEGLTTIKQLRVGRHRLSHATEVPGYSGTRGDLVFNANPTSGSPFAWVCLGSFQWQPLRSS